ncbi:glutamate 5-kinase [Streptomyces sp. NPDC052687]|uniref:glutamate 5-kinase n=1 Tax=Streptomyces sp. NPDC052687 TaxID=3154759 RepID=UPI0034488F6B
MHPERNPDHAPEPAPRRHPDRVVIKVGTSSLVTDGRLDPAKADALAASVAELTHAGVRPVLVASGAIAQGCFLLGGEGAGADEDRRLAAAVGQASLFEAFRAGLARRGLTAAQFLFTPLDLCDREHREGLRSALEQALGRGVVPVVNENDAVRVRNNDVLSALLAVVLRARLLALLTDVPGLYASDPRTDPTARLVPEVKGMSAEVEQLAGASAGGPGTGGMVSKLGAVWIATLAGVTAVIADAHAPRVLRRLLAGEPVGTVVRPRCTVREQGLEPLWRAFAAPPRGTLLCHPAARSDIAAGRAVPLARLVSARGEFTDGDVVDVATAGDPHPIARGRVRLGVTSLSAARTAGDGAHVLLHPNEYVSLLEVC